MGTPKTVEERLRELVGNQFAVEPGCIRRETSFAYDLGADSLDTAETLINVEAEFKRELGGPVPGEVADHTETFGQLLDYVEEKVTRS